MGKIDLVHIRYVHNQNVGKANNCTSLWNSLILKTKYVSTNKGTNNSTSILIIKLLVQ